MSSTARVQAAIRATDRSYLQRQLEMRSGLSDQAQGSVVLEVTPSQLEQILLEAEWQPYTHPELLPGCVAFSAAIPGQLGLKNLHALDPKTPVRLEDPKNTGKVSAVVQGVLGEKVDFFVIILGPDAKNSEVIWTFHPGAPIRPSLVDAHGLTGKTVSARDAIEMGFDLAKVSW